MKFEHKIKINAPAKDIFKLYENVAEWSSWDPDVSSSSIIGEFKDGAVGKLKPSSGPESRILFSSVNNNKSFTVTSNLPLCKMTFEHELFPLKNEVEVVHRVSFTGFLSPIFGRLIGKGIQKSLPSTLKGLKVAAEHKS